MNSNPWILTQIVLLKMAGMQSVDMGKVALYSK